MLLPRRRSDFVLGMSLAEIILLLLFCFFVANILEREASGGQDPNLEIIRLREENARLEARVQALERTVGDLQKYLREKQLLIEQLRKMVGGEGSDIRDFQKAITALKRGLPVCAADNTLLEVLARDATLTITVLTEPSALKAHLADKGMTLKQGETIRDPGEIQALLTRVWDFQVRSSSQCRFDYRLRYATPADYYLARRKVERYLYPEKIVQLQ